MNSQGDYREDEHTLLKRFQEIEPNEYRNIVSYYEENQSSILLLTDADQHRMTRTYLNAVYELGDHIKYCKSCPDYIANLFDTSNGAEDWKKDLTECLYKRSSAQYQMGQLDQAEKTMDQLIRIDPHHPGVKKLFKKILLHKSIEVLQGISAITILTAILASVLIAIELFYIRPFKPEFIIPIETSRIALFSFSVMHFFVAHAIFRLWMNHRANNRIRQEKIRHH